MDDGTTPPETPENGGDKEPPYCDSGNEDQDQTQEDVEPRNIVPANKLARLGGSITTIGAEIYLVLWIWSDFIGCHQVSELWLRGLALMVAYAVLCVTVYKYFKWSLKILVPAWSILTISTAAMGYHNATAPQVRSFRVIAGWCSNTKQGGMWYVANGVATQYHCNALVSFTNLLPVPIMVESYLVEENTSADKWERDDLENVWMSDINGGGAFFFGNVNGDRKDTKEVRFTTLDEAFGNKEIGSNETIRGWIFLKRLWWTNPIRLTIEDSTGRTYSEPLESGARPNPIQPMMMETVRRHVDISAVPELH